MWTFLERKSKRGDRVDKRRTAVAAAEVTLLAGPLAPASWPGHWFHQWLLARGLRPACRTVYRRSAYVGSESGGLRLTLDRGLYGILTEEWSLADVEDGRPLLPEQVILELKFHATLPAPFKELVQGMRLSPGAVSKYRLCRRAWGAADA